MYLTAITKESAIEKLCALSVVMSTLDNPNYLHLALYKYKKEYKSYSIVQLQEQLPQYIVIDNNLN